LDARLTPSTRPIGAEASEILESSGFDLIRNTEDAEPTREWVLKHLANPDVYGVCIMHPHKSDRVDDEFLAACNPNLKVISTCSVGFGESYMVSVSPRRRADAIDHIDVKGANAKGIKIGHTPGVLDDSVADITTMLVLMTMRRVEEGIQLIKNNEVSPATATSCTLRHTPSSDTRWRPTDHQWPTLPWGPFVMTGPSIGHPNLTIGFLGFGRISQETLRRLLVFTSQSAPPTVTYVSSRARPNQAEIDAEFTKKFGVTVKRQEKEEVAAQADILIVLCVQNESTINLVNKDFLRKMKKSAVLVNAARVSDAACSIAGADEID
jgi:glyoxylate/hydroxypyruvate reductase